MNKLVLLNEKNHTRTQTIFQKKLHRRSLLESLIHLCLAIACLLAVQLNPHLIKTANQFFIVFNEPINWSYLIDVSFFICSSPLSKHTSKHQK